MYINVALACLQCDYKILKVASVACAVSLDMLALLFIFQWLKGVLFTHTYYLISHFPPLYSDSRHLF